MKSKMHIARYTVSAVQCHDIKYICEGEAMFNTYLKKNFTALSKSNQKDVETIINQPRYIPFSDRLTTSHIHIDNLLMSQGVKDCMTWKGIALGKSVYDFALIPMIIWENKPATIIEIGSGEGASAIWMADLCKSYNLSTKVISMDIKPPNIEHERVTFLEGNSKQISDFDTKNLPHPWIILEDAHVEVNKVVSHFEKHMQIGDYMIIEDTRGKKGSTLEIPNTLYVDAYYCDYFGLNATSAVNSILRKNRL
jgi:cephalosporin hydroxylase